MLSEDAAVPTVAQEPLGRRYIGRELWKRGEQLAKQSGGKEFVPCVPKFGILRKALPLARVCLNAGATSMLHRPNADTAITFRREIGGSAPKWIGIRLLHQF